MSQELNHKYFVRMTEADHKGMYAVAKLLAVSPSEVLRLALRAQIALHEPRKTKAKAKPRAKAKAKVKPKKR